VKALSTSPIMQKKKKKKSLGSIPNTTQRRRSNIFIPFETLRVEPGALHRLGKCSTTELHSQPRRKSNFINFFLSWKAISNSHPPMLLLALMTPTPLPNHRVSFYHSRHTQIQWVASPSQAGDPWLALDLADTLRKLVFLSDQTLCMKGGA
jgi:hypothetical protein